jgi:hypothetical protein
MQGQANDFVSEKTIAAFVVVPAVPAIIVACYLVLSFASGINSDSLSAFGLIFILAYLVAGTHVLVLGVPAFLLGRHLHAIRWWTCIITAFIIGGLPITLLTWHNSPPTGWWSVFLAWGLFGVSGGLAFWLLWQYWVNRNERANL